MNLSLKKSCNFVKSNTFKIMDRFGLTMLGFIGKRISLFPRLLA